MLKTARAPEHDDEPAPSGFGYVQWRHDQYHSRDSWSPPVNCYRLADRLVVCVDLAGVSKQRIDLRVEPGCLVLCGHRACPEPVREQDEHMHIIAMEIDHGQFRRVLSLPDNVDLAKVSSRYRDGMLWIELPLKQPAA